MTRHVRAVDRRDAIRRAYLGDGVYAAEVDDGGVWLTAENGAEATDAIYLDIDVFKALQRFAARPR